LQACREIKSLDCTRRDLSEICRRPVGAEANEDFLAAIGRLKHNKNAFAFPFESRQLARS